MILTDINIAIEEDPHLTVVIQDILSKKSILSHRGETRISWNSKVFCRKYHDQLELECPTAKPMTRLHSKGSSAENIPLLGAMLCYAMLCYALLCYDMLCYPMLCYAMLCYAMLCYAILCYAILYYVMLCCAVLCYAMLCYAMLCYAVLCYAVLTLQKPLSLKNQISTLSHPPSLQPFNYLSNSLPYC